MCFVFWSQATNMKLLLPLCLALCVCCVSFASASDSAIPEHFEPFNIGDGKENSHKCAACTLFATLAQQYADQSKLPYKTIVHQLCEVMFHDHKIVNAICATFVNHYGKAIIKEMVS